MAVLSQTIGQEIADALGISMKGITGIKIELKTNQVVSVDVSYYPGFESLNGCLEVLRRYQLTERKNSVPESSHWRDRIDQMADSAKSRIHEMARWARFTCDIDPDPSEIIRRAAAKRDRYA